MKVSRPTENIASLQTLIIQLQLTLELSQIQENLLTETALSTQDPARDGSNWYGYCGQNPVMFQDPSGLFYYTGSGQQSSSTPATSNGSGSKNPNNQGNSGSQGQLQGQNQQQEKNNSAQPSHIKTTPTNGESTGYGQNGHGANYDQIMNELEDFDLSNGVPFEYVFAHTVFNKNNSLNQLILDKALGINSNSSTTVSCQTTALINAYANNIKDGITGQNILNVLIKNENGTFGNEGLVDKDGSPKDLNKLSKAISNELKMNKHINVGEKNPVNLVTSMKVGVIAGLTNSKGQHFIYKNSNITVDSLDPKRAATSTYRETSYRTLSWQSN